MRRIPRFLVLSLMVAVALPALAWQSPDPDSPRWKGVMALSEFIGSEGDDAVESFLTDRIDPAVREKVGDEAVRAFLIAFRAELAGAQIRGGQPRGPLAAAVMLNLADGGDATVEFELSDADSDRFVYISSPGHTLES